MGDRANIVVKDGSSEIYMYSHWGGCEMPATLQAGLKRGRGRWSDPAYLTRILFCEMIQGDVLGETGFGISTGICDNEHPILLVDCPSKTVAVVKVHNSRGGWKEDRINLLAKFTFQEFCDLALGDNGWDVILSEKSDE